jgi:hypothetical protein
LTCSPAVVFWRPGGPGSAAGAAGDVDEGRAVYGQYCDGKPCCRTGAARRLTRAPCPTPPPPPGTSDTSAADSIRYSRSKPSSNARSPARPCRAGCRPGAAKRLSIGWSHPNRRTTASARTPSSPDPNAGLTRSGRSHSGSQKSSARRTVHFRR